MSIEGKSPEVFLVPGEIDEANYGDSLARKGRAGS
jgi:hypothetical protein